MPVVWLQGSVLQTGVGGGGGFQFGTGTVNFTNNAARNTYFTANPGMLAQYDTNEFLLIHVGTAFQRRENNAWVTVTNIVKGEKGDEGDKGDKGDADEYFVLAASVAQTNANKDITLTITGVTAYAAGQEAIFHTKTGANGTANVRLQINALGYKNLLKEDGTEFEANELEPMTQIRAIYDGTNFLSDFARRSQTHFLDTADVTRTGDAYSITDATIQGTGIGKPIIIGLESEADNVGNVTISINGSTDYPVLLSDGSQIPAGSFKTGQVALCVFSTIGMVGWHAINLRPPRKLKGVLVATATMPAASYLGSDYIAWQIPAGITELSTEPIPAANLPNSDVDLAGGLLLLPNDRFSTAQLGWFIEITKGTTSVYTRLELFGYVAGFGNTVTTTDGVISFLIFFNSADFYPGIDKISLDFGIDADVTTTEEYLVSVYVVEN